jgi:hypothetical protein
MFDCIPVSAVDRPESEACSLQCSCEMLCVIDEKYGLGDVVFFTKCS